MLSISRGLALVFTVSSLGLPPAAAHAQQLLTDLGTQDQLTSQCGPVNPPNTITVVFGGQSIKGVSDVGEVVEYKDPEDMTMRYRPGNNKTTRIRITRPWSGTPEWMNAVANGNSNERKSGQINAADFRGASQGSITVTGCFPSKWNGPNLKSMGSAHATESIELTCESIDYSSK